MRPALTDAGARQSGDWRRRLRNGVAWVLLLKLIALVLLKGLFFSATQRVEVTPGLMDARLSLDATAPLPSPRPETPDD